MLQHLFNYGMSIKLLRFIEWFKKPVKRTLACYILWLFIVHKFFVFSFVFLVYYILLHLSYYTLFHGFLQTTP